MTGAPCPHCGGQVMSYRHYATHVTLNATCQECGARLRQGRFWLSVVLAFGLLATFIYLWEVEAVPFAASLVSLAIVAFALDIAWFKRGPWRLVAPPAEAAVPTADRARAV